MQAVYSLPCGTLLLTFEDTILTGLTVGGTPTLPSTPTAFSDQVHAEVLAYLQGKCRHFSFAYRADGTSFQQSVWTEITHVPYGETLSYRELAARTGRPDAVRAVAGACSRNPIWFVIPCHRIIGSDGRLHGYAGGLVLKKQLLDLERQSR